jgi:hypothetical protein
LPKIPYPLWNPNIYYHVYKSWALGPILSQFNPVAYSRALSLRRVSYHPIYT